MPGASATIKKGSYNLAGIVDPTCAGVDGSRNIERSKTVCCLCRYTNGYEQTQSHTLEHQLCFHGITPFVKNERFSSYITFLILTVSQTQYIIGFAAARTSGEPGNEFMTQPQAQSPDRIVHVALSALAGPEACNPREAQAFGIRESFFWFDRTWQTVARP